MALSISKDGDATTPLGTLCHSVGTLGMKKCFLTSRGTSCVPVRASPVTGTAGMRRQVPSAPSFRHLGPSVNPSTPHLPGLLQTARAGSAAEREAGGSRRSRRAGAAASLPGSAPVRSLRSAPRDTDPAAAPPAAPPGSPGRPGAPRPAGPAGHGAAASLPATPRPGRFRRVQSSSTRDCVAATLQESPMLPRAEPPAAPAPPGPASRRSLTVPGPASQGAPGAHRATPIGWRTRHSAGAPPLRLTRRIRNYAYWLARPSLRWRPAPPPRLTQCRSPRTLPARMEPHPLALAAVTQATPRPRRRALGAADRRVYCAAAAAPSPRSPPTVRAPPGPAARPRS